jgi:ABC-type transport system involved in multi-copper enzyme maturation permease subunit
MYVSGTNVTFPTQVYSVYYDSTSINRGYVVVQAEQDLSNITTVTFSDNTTTLTRTVVQVTPMNQVILSGSPDSEPSGIITFATVSWTYDLSKIYAGETTQSNFGNASGNQSKFGNSSSNQSKFENTSGNQSNFGNTLNQSNFGNSTNNTSNNINIVMVIAILCIAALLFIFIKNEKK